MLLNTDNVNVENNTFENNIATIEGQNIISIGNNTFGDDNIYDGLLVLNKTSLALNLSSDSIPVNKKVIITVELAGLSNYTNVEVKLNITPGRQESILLNGNGIGSIEIANLSARVYEIVAYYEGNTQYAEVNSTTKVLTVLNATNTLSFTDLNETINNNSEAVIYLDGNYTFDSAVDTDLINGIVIDRDIVIDGMGNTIDGAALSRIFYLTEHVKNFELRNVTVKNAKADNGAVIRVNGSLDTFVLNGTFTDNYATGSGSVLYSANAINDCILDGTYYKNHAGSNGGVIYLSGGNVSLVGNFTENYANSYGGVLNGAVNLVLSGYFEDNYAATQSGGVAHISSSTNTVLNGTFIGNNANKYGGVFSTYRGMRSVDLSGTFEDNSAGVAGGVGAISIGGAYSTGNITLTGDFTGNNAPNAAILWTDNNGDSVNSVIIENATVTDNDATTGGIIELRNVKDANISNSNFTGNYAPLGVVYITGTDIDINEINLTDNTGNGINVNSTDAYLSNITIDNVDEGNAIVVNGDNTIIDNVNINNVG